MIGFIHEAVERKRVVLVHCDTGTCVSYAVVLAYMLAHRRLRLKDSVEHLEQVRAQLALSLPMSLGLEDMQHSLDARKMRRLEDRLRKAPVMAIQF